MQAASNPGGATSGASAPVSQVTLQARKPAILVIRQGDGRILFEHDFRLCDAYGNLAAADGSVRLTVNGPGPAVGGLTALASGGGAVFLNGA